MPVDGASRHYHCRSLDLSKLTLLARDLAVEQLAPMLTRFRFRGEHVTVPAIAERCRGRFAKGPLEHPSQVSHTRSLPCPA